MRTRRRQTRIAHSAPSDGATIGYIGGDRDAWLTTGDGGTEAAHNANEGVCSGDVPAGSAWDSAMVAVSRGFLVDEERDVLTFFKYGDHLRHGQCIAVGQGGGCVRQNASRGGKFARLQLRRDGFASIGPSGNGEWSNGATGMNCSAAAAASATFTTKAFAVTAGGLKLELYVDSAAVNGGKLLVEVLNAAGQVDLHKDPCCEFLK